MDIDPQAPRPYSGLWTAPCTRLPRPLHLVRRRRVIGLQLPGRWFRNRLKSQRRALNEQVKDLARQFIDNPKARRPRMPEAQHSIGCGKVEQFPAKPLEPLLDAMPFFQRLHPPTHPILATQALTHVGRRTSARQRSWQIKSGKSGTPDAASRARRLNWQVSRGEGNACKPSPAIGPAAISHLLADRPSPNSLARS